MEDLDGIGIETLAGVVLLREVPVVIGVGSQMALRRHSVAGDGVVLYEEKRGTEIVTMITGGYRHLEGIVTLRPPGVVGVAVVVGTVGTEETAEGAGEGQGIRDLVVRPAEILVTIELAVDPDKREDGVLCGISTQGRLYSNIWLTNLLPLSNLLATAREYPYLWPCLCKSSP